MDVNYDILVGDSEYSGKIGTYQFKKVDGKLVLEGEFLRHVYYLQDVTCGLDFGMSATDVSTVGSGKAEMEWDSDYTVSFDFPAPTADDLDAPGNYGITKTAAAEVTQPFIEYKIEVTATGKGDLAADAEGNPNGKWISDTLPAGLVYESVKVTLVGTSVTSPVDLSTELQYTDTLNYQITGTEVTKVTIDIKAVLTAEKMEAYMNAAKNGKGFEQKFENSVALSRDEAAKEKIAESKAATEMELPVFFGKEGQPSATDNRVYDWTITVNTYGTADKIYIIDSLDTSVHNYIGNITIQAEGEVAKTFALEDKNGLATKLSYEELTSGALDTQESFFAGLSTDKAAYYKTADDKGILIIPYKDFINKNVTIKYQTKMKGTTGTSVANVSNKAKLIWKGYEYGPGPGPWENPDFGFDIGKTYTPNTKVVTKSAGAYDPKTQIATWDFVVNAFSTDKLDNVTITDTLDRKKQEFLLFDTHDNLVLTGESGTLNVPYYAPESLPGSGNYYTFKTGSENNITFELHLEAAAIPRYTFSLDTKVVDPIILTANGANTTLANSIAVNATVDGVSIDQQEVSASKTVKHEILKKEAVGKYDYTDHTIGWKITINADKIPIDDAKIQDDLPLGTYVMDADPVTITVAEDSSVVNTTWGALKTGVTVDGKTVTAILADSTGTLDGKTYQKNSFTLDFGDKIEKTYTIAYKTTVEEPFRRYVMRNNAVKFDNSCAYVSPSAVYAVFVTAGDAATHNVTAEPLAKSGTYKVVANTDSDKAKYGADKVGLGVVSWTVVINRNAVDMTGAVIADELADVFELDTDSLVLKTANIASDGKATAGSPVDLSKFTPKIDFTSFSLTIPTEYKDTPLLLTFNTYLVKDAGKDELTNRIGAQLADGDAMDSGTQTAANAANFDFDKYASASVAPMLTINKKSSTKDEDGGSYINLPDAEFEIYEMKYDGTAWVEVRSKVRSTTSNGVATFMFLKRGIMYRLTEAAAPDGYAIDPKEYYFWFEPTGGASLVDPVPAGENVEFTTFIDRLGNLTIENKPLQVDSNALVIQKVSGDGRPMAGVTFTLTSTTGGKTFATTQTTGADGQAAFSGLDPGMAYCLTETLPTGCTAAVTQWDIKVSFDTTTGEFAYEICPDGGVYEAVAGPYTIVNAYTNSSISLVGVELLVDALGVESEKRQSGAVFAIYHLNEKVGYLAWDDATEAYIPSTCGDATLAKNSFGSAYIQPNGAGYGLLPGDYSFLLETIPTGVLPDDVLYAFAVPDSGVPVAIRVDGAERYVFVKAPEKKPDNTTADDDDDDSGSSATPDTKVASKPAAALAIPAGSQVLPAPVMLAEKDNYKMELFTYTHNGAEEQYLKIEVTQPGGVIFKSLPTPVRAGYTFDGWYSDPECTELYLLGGTAVPRGLFYLYPGWVPLHSNPNMGR